MYFEVLQRRLVEALRRLTANGVVTERGLARWAGISQPHMHHILKGVRTLSPQLADRILRAFQLTVTDLLERAEMQARPGRAPPHCAPLERIQALVDEVRATQEEAGLGPPSRRTRSGVSAGGSWPLPDRSPRPGAPPPTN